MGLGAAGKDRGWRGSLALWKNVGGGTLSGVDVGVLRKSPPTYPGVPGLWTFSLASRALIPEMWRNAP